MVGPGTLMTVATAAGTTPQGSEEVLASAALLPDLALMAIAAGVTVTMARGVMAAAVVKEGDPLPLRMVAKREAWRALRGVRETPGRQAPLGGRRRS